MNTESFFEDMNLPNCSANEDLETLSKQKLALLLDTNRFEVRPEDLRDKGVDLHLELKKKGKYLNIRCMVRLKATAKVPINIDGSYSLSIETTNVNYLLNSGMPSFYVFYVKEKDQFFYQSVQDFVGKLSQRMEDWQVQETHTLRFEKLFDEKGVSALYENTLQRGIFNRKIN